MIKGCKEVIGDRCSNPYKNREYYNIIIVIHANLKTNLSSSFV